MKPWQVVIYEFFCITSISLMIGMGLGVIQSFLAFRSLTFIKDGTIIGGLWATIVGPFVYYILLRKILNIKNAANLIVLCIGAGCVSALILGWFSSFVTPLVLILGAIIIRLRANDKMEDK